MNRLNRFLRLCCCLCLGLGLLIGIGQTSRADVSDVGEYGKAKLVISNRPGEFISELEWNSFDLPVHTLKKGDTRRAYVILEGTLNHPDANLVFGQRNVPLTPNASGGGSFQQMVPLTGKITLLTYNMVDAYGRTEQEKIALVFPDWNKFSLPLTKTRPLRRLLASAGFSLSYEHYTEPTPADVSMVEYTTTGKFSLAYLLDPDKWELGGNTFVNLLPLEHNPSDLSSAWWYGINGRIGYHLPMDWGSTSFWLMTGWYMWGMYVNAPADQSYGVSFLSGPQLFLNARITPPLKRVGWLYLKFASITDPKAGIVSFSNREIAGGAGMSVSKPGVPHPISVSVDVADAKYSDPSQTHMFHLLSVGVGMSVGL